MVKNGALPEQDRVAIQAGRGKATTAVLALEIVLVTRDTIERVRWEEDQVHVRWIVAAGTSYSDMCTNQFKASRHHDVVERYSVCPCQCVVAVLANR